MEKLSDTKQVVRDVTLDCCTIIIQKFKPAQFVNQTINALQHANWHVREGILILFARSQLESGQQELQNLNRLLEEVCFAIKVEDKPSLVQLSIDNLVLALHQTSDKDRVNEKIEKELEYNLDDEESKITQAYDSLIARLDASLIPFIN